MANLALTYGKAIFHTVVYVSHSFSLSVSFRFFLKVNSKVLILCEVFSVPDQNKKSLFCGAPIELTLGVLSSRKVRIMP